MDCLIIQIINQINKSLDCDEGLWAEFQKRKSEKTHTVLIWGPDQCIFKLCQRSQLHWFQVLKLAFFLFYIHSIKTINSCKTLQWNVPIIDVNRFAVDNYYKTAKTERSAATICKSNLLMVKKNTLEESLRRQS